MEDPYASGQLLTYAAGSSTPLETYSDTGLSVANPTTITLNAAGRPSVSSVEVSVFLLPRAYKFVLKNSAGTTVWTVDNVYPSQAAGSVSPEVTGTAGEEIATHELCYLSDGSGSTTAGRWYKADVDLGTHAGIYPQLGFATSAIASGATGLLRVGGSIDGFGGMTPGARDHASGTAGAIFAAGSVFQRCVGVALSATELLIDFDRHWKDGGFVNMVTTAVGNQDNFAIVPPAREVMLRCNNASTLTLRGIFNGFSTSVVASRTIYVVSIGAGDVVLKNQDSNSEAQARFITGTGADVTISAGATPRTLRYDVDTARWRLF